MNRASARERKMTNAYKIFVAKPEGKKPRLIHWRKQDDNIKKNLMEMGWGKSRPNSSGSE
jgi:D-lyxose ketol-isomerase